MPFQPMKLETHQEVIFGSDRLKVKVARPGTVYTGSRFDWTGFITQVELDARHTFCAHESLTPGYGTGGIGLCAAFEPMPSAEVPVGGRFAKPGVGLLTQTADKPYSFLDAYQVEPFQVHEQVSDRSLIQVSEPLPCDGYAFRTTRTMTVEANRLVVSAVLENCGAKPVETEEFGHNFVCIDEHPIGPAYQLTLPYAPQLAIRCGDLWADGQTMYFGSIPADYFYCSIGGGTGTPGHAWELVCPAVGAGMRETGAFAVSRFNMWGRRHVVSPEVFVALRVRPGDSWAWTRTFEFFTV